MQLIQVSKTLPTPGDLHVNAALTNMAIAWKQDAKRFVAGRVFPEVPVEKQSDRFFVWDENDFFRDEAEEKTANSKAPLINLRLSNTTYFAKEYILGGLVSESDLANQDAAVNKDEATTRALMNKMMIKREKVFLANFFTTGKWTGSTTAADLVGGTDFQQWDNYAASNPVTDIRAQVVYLSRLGVDPMSMKLTVGVQVFQKLLDHPRFLERYEQVQASILNEQLMAAVLGIGEVVVAYAAETTTAEGAATGTVSFILGKNALLTYSPPAVSKEEPSAGYTFNWSGLIGSGQDGIRIRRWFQNDPAGWMIVSDAAYDLKQTSAKLGVFFSAAVA